MDVAHDSDWKLPWDAGCRCGGLRMGVTQPPIVTIACHCPNEIVKAIGLAFGQHLVDAAGHRARPRFSRLGAEIAADIERARTSAR